MVKERTRRTLVAAGWSVLGILTLAYGQEVKPAASGINVQESDLLVEPPSANWISYNGDYSGRRYSSVSEVNTRNVQTLRAQWVFHAQNSDRLEVTPVVVNHHVRHCCE
jgi:alcohol dehydrogenase (cytochrome c)